MTESRIGCFLALFPSAEVSMAWVQSMAEYHSTNPHYSLLALFRPLFINKEPKVGLMLFPQISFMDWFLQNEDGGITQVMWAQLSHTCTVVFSCPILDATETCSILVQTGCGTNVHEVKTYYLRTSRKKSVRQNHCALSYNPNGK